MMALAVLSYAVACSDYDDSEIKSDIEDLQDRVTTLEGYVTTLNNQVSSISSAVSAIESVTYVTDLTTLTENGTVTGYTITFSDGSSFTIYNGTDGEDGEEGSTPVIGVTLVDGVYYWTLDGEIIYDSDGNPLRASAQEGEAGSVPQLKIEDGYWYVSYDDGETWEQLGEVSGWDVQYITNVTYDSDYVYITLYDGTTLPLSIKEALSITFDLPTIGIESAGESVDVTYTLTGADESTTVKTIAKDNYTAVVTATDSESGVITITAPSSGYDDSEVIVIVSNEETTLMRVISIKTSGFIAATTSAVTTGVDAGEVLVPVTTNLEYTVSIPDDAADWLSYTETRTVRTDTLVFTVTENNAIDDRYTTVTLTSTDESVTETVLITQEGNGVLVNENWAVVYDGKALRNDTYYDRISYYDYDGSTFACLVGSSSVFDYLDAGQEEDLMVQVQEMLDYYISYYDNYYSGYYLANYSYSTSVALLYSGLSSDTEYIAMMYGVNDDGLLTGYYQVSDPFTLEELEASDEYLAWIGTWSYTDSNEKSGTLTFSQCEPEISYYMVQNSSFPSVEVSYSTSDHTITIDAYDTGVTGTSSSYGDYNVYWWAKAYVSSASKTYYVTGTGYEIATIALGEDGTTATVTGSELSLSAGTGQVTYMGYFCYLDSGAGYLTYSNAPLIALPLDLTLSSSTTAVQSNSRSNTGSETFTKGSLSESVRLDPAPMSGSSRAILVADYAE